MENGFVQRTINWVSNFWANEVEKKNKKKENQKEENQAKENLNPPKKKEITFMKSDVISHLILQKFLVARDHPETEARGLPVGNMKSIALAYRNRQNGSGPSEHFRNVERRESDNFDDEDWLYGEEPY